MDDQLSDEESQTGQSFIDGPLITQASYNLPTHKKNFSQVITEQKEPFISGDDDKLSVA